MTRRRSMVDTLWSVGSLRGAAIITQAGRPTAATCNLKAVKTRFAECERKQPDRGVSTNFAGRRDLAPRQGWRHDLVFRSQLQPTASTNPASSTTAIMIHGSSEAAIWD